MLSSPIGKNIDILFEDNHLLVVVKPPNIPSQGDESGDPDMLNLLKADLKNRYQKPGNVFLGLIHRLDRPAGGVMVFAKTSKSASRLSDQVRTRSIEKYYHAVVHNVPEHKSAVLEHDLLKNSDTNRVSVSLHPNKEAKKAVLRYSVVEQKECLSLVRIHLLTGRPHQIRVQMSFIGCPLFGDQKYGSSVNLPGQQLALWSSLLQFKHPVSKESLSFQAAPPNEYPWSLWPETTYYSEEKI